MNRRRNRDAFRPDAHHRYIAFNKPFEVLTQFTQPEGSNKDTLAGFGFPADVYPVGRLDYDSEGLLLLSDDPTLNKILLGPEYRHSRTYLAQVEGIPSAEALKRLEEGIVIEGRTTLPARARLLPEPPLFPPRPVPIRYRKEIPTAWIELTLTEGRNRQVRRMTAAAGHPTLRLIRIAIGALELPLLGLLPGEWRDLDREQIMMAFETRGK